MARLIAFPGPFTTDAIMAPLIRSPRYKTSCARCAMLLSGICFHRAWQMPIDKAFDQLFNRRSDIVRFLRQRPIVRLNR